MSEAKPRRVKAKITRTVTEIAIVDLDRDGNIEDVNDILDELEWDNGEVESIFTVLSVHS